MVAHQVDCPSAFNRRHRTRTRMTRAVPKGQWTGRGNVVPSRCIQTCAYVRVDLMGRERVFVTRVAQA
jgi:hypothetical protein